MLKNGFFTFDVFFWRHEQVFFGFYRLLRTVMQAMGQGSMSPCLSLCYYLFRKNYIIFFVILVTTFLSAQNPSDLHIANTLLDSGKYEVGFEKSIFCWEDATKDAEIRAECLLTGIFCCLEQGKYAEAKANIEKVNIFLISNHLQNTAAFARFLNHKGEYFTRISQHADARANHLAALALRQKLWGDAHAEVADSYNNLGNINILLGNFSEALVMHQKSLQIRNTIFGETHLKTAVSYANLGNVYFYQNHFKEAILFYEKSLYIREPLLGAEHPIVARLYNNLGAANLYSQAYLTARNWLQKALKSYENNPTIAPFVTAKIQNNLGKCTEASGDFQKARDYYTLALHILEENQVGNEAALTETYANIGNNYANIGDFGTALPYQEQVLRLQKALLGEKHPDTATAMDETALCLRHSGRATEAFLLHQAALKIRQGVQENQSTLLIASYNNLGSCLLEQKNYKSAIVFYKKAVAIAEKSQLAYTATGYKNIGTCFFEAGDNAAALSNFQQALALLQAKKAISTLPFTELYQNIALTLVRKSDFKQALYYLAVAEKTLDPSESATYFLFLKTKAYTQLAAYRHTKAVTLLAPTIADYEKLLAKLDDLRTNFHTNSSKEKLLSDNFLLFEELLEAYYAQYQATKARDILPKMLQIHERSQDAILMETLQNMGNIAIPDSLLQNAQQLEDAIAATEKQQYEALNKQETSDTDIGILNARLSNFRLRRNNLLQEIQRATPKFLLPNALNTSALTRFLRSICNENKAFISFFCGKSNVYALIFHKGTYEMVCVPLDFALEKHITQLRESIYAYASASGTAADIANNKYIESARLLYEKLIKPLEIYHLPEKLIIVPSGALSYIPFEALLTAVPSDNFSFKHFPYLLNRYQISYNYSAGLLRYTQELTRKKNIKQEVAAFAPTFSASSRFGELLFNKKEAEAVIRTMGGQLFSDTAATIAAFRRTAPLYAVLHLSTHGQANREASNFSSIAFSANQDSIDNVLYINDLYRLQLNADLVVLSACETGIGSYHLGEGVVSLARGFTYAGAKSTINTLWSIDDASSAQLMEAFYAHLKAGLPKDEALYLAKKEFITDHPNASAHPFFWAAYIPIGDMQPLDFSGGRWWWFLGVAILGIAGWIFWKKKRM
jgi:CHAT domain-containing protein